MSGSFSGACNAIGGRPVVPFRRSVMLRVCVGMLLLAVAPSVFSQELTPRAYWPAPNGTKFVLAGYAYSTGDVVTDPTLPVAGVDSSIHQGVIAYQQTISLAGRTTNFQMQLPYADSSTTGLLAGTPVNREVSGVGDFSATLAINLMGAPSMTREEFQEFRKNPKPILATSLKVVVPTGEYEPDKLINVGTNRWAGKLKLGYLRPMPGRWVLEMAAGVWVFQDNDEFLGVTREQEPVTALDLNVVKRFRPGFWGSIDANYFLGGRTTVDGDKNADFQRNSRLGFSLAYPFGGGQAVKFSFSAGVVTSSGNDYNTLLLNYIYRLP